MVIQKASCKQRSLTVPVDRGWTPVEPQLDRGWTLGAERSCFDRTPGRRHLSFVITSQHKKKCIYWEPIARHNGPATFAKKKISEFSEFWSCVFLPPLTAFLDEMRVGTTRLRKHQQPLRVPLSLQVLFRLSPLRDGSDEKRLEKKRATERHALLCGGRGRHSGHTTKEKYPYVPKQLSEFVPTGLQGRYSALGHV